MKNDLTTLRNIGPKIADRIKAVGIETADDFKNQDPYEVFNNMTKKEPSLCRCALASVVGASLDTPWMKIHKKAAAEFDKKYPNHVWQSKC